LIKGKVKVFTEQGVWEVSAPATMTSEPGFRMVAMALEDSLIHSVHKDTGTRNLDEAENIHFELPGELLHEGQRVAKELLAVEILNKGLPQ
jgi:hypothetical protein